MAFVPAILATTVIATTNLLHTSISSAVRLETTALVAHIHVRALTAQSIKI
jgi:hypothetical protein